MEEVQIDQHSFDWILLPKDPFMMKFVVKSSGYHIILSNLVFMYGENLKERDVQKRFHELNLYADMKPDLILQNINGSLCEFLDNKANHVLNHNDDTAVLTLYISTKFHSYRYEVRFSLLPANQILDFIISPTIIGALLCENKIKELERSMQLDKNLSSNISSTSIVTSSSMPSASFTSISVSKNEMKSDSNTEKFSAQMHMQSFVKLQKFFHQLSSENLESFHSLRKENLFGDSSNQSGTILKKKYDKEKTNDLSQVAIEYKEEEQNSVKENPVDLQTCVKQEEPVSKKSKIKNLKF